MKILPLSLPRPLRGSQLRRKQGGGADVGGRPQACVINARAKCDRGTGRPRASPHIEATGGIPEGRSP